MINRNVFKNKQKKCRNKYKQRKLQKINKQNKKFQLNSEKFLNIYI